MVQFDLSAIEASIAEQVTAWNKGAIYADTIGLPTFAPQDLTLPNKEGRLLKYFSYPDAIELERILKKHGWRLPTEDELSVLCNVAYKTRKVPKAFQPEPEPSGYIVDGEIDAYSNGAKPGAPTMSKHKSIFCNHIPATLYWASSKLSSKRAHGLEITHYYVSGTLLHIVSLEKGCGLHIRCVRDDDKKTAIVKNWFGQDIHIIDDNKNIVRTYTSEKRLMPRKSLYEKSIANLDGVQIIETRYVHTHELPAYQEGVYYIVDPTVIWGFQGRRGLRTCDDLLMPDDPVFNKAGKIVGYRKLARIKHP